MLSGATKIWYFYCASPTSTWLTRTTFLPPFLFHKISYQISRCRLALYLRQRDLYLHSICPRLGESSSRDIPYQPISWTTSPVSQLISSSREPTLGSASSPVPSRRCSGLTLSSTVSCSNVIAFTNHLTKPVG